MSHRGHDENVCGSWTLPCRSVRKAVKISNANDDIYIDYAEGKPYKECEHVIFYENHTIMLDKSLSFYGFNGSAILHCEQTYPFFGINNSAYTTSKVVLIGLTLASRGILFNADYKIPSMFHLEFNFCDIKRTTHVIKATSLSCSIQILNSYIRSDMDPLDITCRNLATHLIGSIFFSCPIFLASSNLLFRKSYDEPALNVHIYNCTFLTIKRLLCDSFVIFFPQTLICNITVKSSVFTNSYHTLKMPKTSALMVSSSQTLSELNIILDGLRFENIDCDDGVVSLILWASWDDKPFIVEILNTAFVNTGRALNCIFIRQFSNNIIKLHNNTFNITRGIFGDGLSPILLRDGSFHFSSCQFYFSVPAYNPTYALVDAQSAFSVTFTNCLFESYLIEGIRNSSWSNSDMFYIISYNQMTYETPHLDIKGYFTIYCPRGYWMHLNTDCSASSDKTITPLASGGWCHRLNALCIQCPRKTYSLDRGEVRNLTSNHITCHDCPVGGNCFEGQVTSKPNFWGYESNREIKFLQCPPQYCCDNKQCKHYKSCNGNRMGALCGKCPSGMSESLFDTKCIPSKDCTSASFWPAISVYVILYLLFFLYLEDILSFAQRLINRTISASTYGRNSEPGGLLKILFYYYQVIQLLNKTVGSDGKVGLLDDVKKFLSRTLNFLITAIPGFDCPFKDLRAVQKAIIVHSVGYTLLALLCFLYVSTFIFKLLNKLWTKQCYETIDQSPELNENPFLARIAGAFANISLLMYSSSTHLCLSLLQCVPLKDHQVLFLDANITCYRTFQYYLLFYMISSILPFCLVPVLGSYLLKLKCISVAQFCLACIFPLPFCCYWAYLLVRNSSWRMKCSYHGNRSEGIQNDGDNCDGLNTAGSIETENEDLTEFSVCNSAVLRVLVGPFRRHKATFIFPASHLPWEGVLILRRLALILVLTFVYDNRVKTTLSMIFCVVFLLPQVFVKPFKNERDNVLEILSLVMLIIISFLSVVKTIYYGENLDSSSKSLLNLINVIESILTIAPMAVIFFTVILFILFKIVIMFRSCYKTVFRRLKRFKQTNRVPPENYASEEIRPLLSSQE